MNLKKQTKYMLGVLGFTMSLSAMGGTYTQFVGESDAGSVRVKNCNASGVGGTASFSNNTALNVGVEINLGGGDGEDADDVFNAVFNYGLTTTPFMDGIWSFTNSSTNGTETYTLVPSGDLAMVSTAPTLAPGWGNLLAFINDLAGQACNTAAPTFIYPTLSVIKAELKVLPTTVAGGRAATLKMTVKTVMDNGDGVPAKSDEVAFQYRATGYVVP